jgi:hypothetical protein
MGSILSLFLLSIQKKSIVNRMGDDIYSVDLANGDLYSKSQRQYAKETRTTGGKHSTEATRLKSRKLFEQPRAQGKTGTTRLPLTEAEKLTIMKLSGEGRTPDEIGVAVKRATSTIVSLLRRTEAEARKVGIDWKEIQKQKAVSAVNDALDHKEDLYKRGTIGISALKGLGEYEKDSVGSITAILGAIPANMRDRYLSSADLDMKDDAIPATVTEVPDAV